MILDNKYIIKNGKKILMKLAPTILGEHGLTVIDGWIQFDLKKFSWQPVKTDEQSTHEVTTRRYHEKHSGSV